MELDWSNKTIVVIDDTEVNYILIKTQLRKMNANMVWLENGKDAIEYIQNKKAADILLMDIRMPVLDGIEATERIKKIAPDLPIVIQTASVMGDAYEGIASSGCDDVIFKPIMSAKLIEVISKQFEKYSKK